MGGSLFVRNNRTVTLTERGVGFLPFARQALEALQKGMEAAALTERGQQGELRVGVLRSIAGGFIAPALQRFLQAYPHLHCRVDESNHWQLVEWLYDNKIEHAIITWPPIGPQIAEVTPLHHFREPVVLLAHRTHPLAQRQQVTREDVVRLSDPLILLRWWQITPEPLVQMAQLAGQILDVPTDTGRYLIANGHGAGFFNRGQVTPELLGEEMVEIDVIDLPRLFRDSALGAAVAEFNAVSCRYPLYGSCTSAGQALGFS